MREEKSTNMFGSYSSFDIHKRSVLNFTPLFSSQSHSSSSSISSLFLLLSFSSVFFLFLLYLSHTFHYFFSSYFSSSSSCSKVFPLFLLTILLVFVSFSCCGFYLCICICYILHLVFCWEGFLSSYSSTSSIPLISFSSFYNVSYVLISHPVKDI